MTNPAVRGRRDPQLAARLREPEPEPEYEGEGDLEPTVEAEDMLGDEGDFGPSEIVLLFPGDVVMVRSAQSGKDYDGNEVWHSAGVQTRVQVDEDPFDTSARARAYTRYTVEQLETEAEDRKAELREAARRRPIRPAGR